MDSGAAFGALVPASEPPRPPHRRRFPQFRVHTGRLRRPLEGVRLLAVRPEHHVLEGGPGRPGPAPDAEALARGRRLQ